MNPITKILFSILLLFYITHTVEAQSNIQELKYMMRNKGYSISSEQYQYLERGETARYTKTFYAGTEYVIVAYSESSGVYDIDLTLYDDDGSVLTKDTDTSSTAIIQYLPRFTRNMRVVMKNYNSGSRSYQCEFIIFYK